MLKGLEGARALALTLLAALALGAAACGSDDGDGESDAKPGGGAASGDVQQLDAAYDAFVEDLYAKRWEEACAAYSTDYVKRYPKQIKLADTCVQTMQLEYTAVGDGKRPQVYEVVMRGPARAIATIKMGENDKGQGFPMKFVKESGSWKLDGPAPWKDYGKGVPVNGTG